MHPMTYFLISVIVLSIIILFALKRKKMTKYIETISESEFMEIREYLNRKSEQLMIWEKKEWAHMGSDISKFAKVSYADRTFFVISSGNVFKELINNVLPEACLKYPQNFGQNSTKLVFEALYNIEPAVNFEYFPEFLNKEKFAWIVELESHGVSDKILRIDLFRMDKTTEFVGGIFHAFRHFSYRGIPLSTLKANTELNHPNNILFHLINAFFIQGIKFDKAKGAGLSYLSEISYSSKYNLRFYFFLEPNTNIHFLDTTFISKS